MTRTISIGLVAIAAGAVAVVGAQQAIPTRDGRQAALTGRSSLSGIVAAAGSGTPIAGADIGIFGTENGLIRIATADERGRFVIAALPAGRYLLSATKPPYVDALYGATEPGRPGTAIALSDDEVRTGVVLTMIRGAIITGTVMDERGQPAPDVSVDVTQPRSGNSNAQMLRSMMMAPRVMTDDRGVFRFSGLAPGDYIVAVTPSDAGGGVARVVTADDLEAAARLLREPAPAPPPTSQTKPPASTVILPPQRGGTPLIGFSPGAMPMPAGMPFQGPTVGFAPIYYPGSTDMAEAVAITVSAGEERRGVDVVARMVRTTRIDGVVLTADGQPASGVLISSRRTGRDDLLSLPRMLSMMSTGSARTSPDGRFTLNGLAPGKYTLEARSAAASAGSAMGVIVGRLGGAGGSSAPSMWASTEVSASGEPLSGLVLRLQPGLTLSGRIAFDAVSATPPKEASTVMVAAGDVLAGSGFLSGMSGVSVAAAADGTFTLSGLVPGRYLLSASMTGPDPTSMLTWLSQTVIVDGRDLSDLPIDIRADQTVKDLVITLSDRQQALNGTLQDAAGRPAPDFTVLLFPADKKYWLPSSRRILTTRPGTDGRFAFRGPLGPPAGDYWLAAVTDLRPDDEYNPAFLEVVAKAAVRIVLSPGQTRTQDLRLVK